MADFAFLQAYIATLPARTKKTYILNEGKGRFDLAKAEKKGRIKIPNELKEFYEFSYGARLGGYKMLTVPEVVETVEEMKSIYGDDLKKTILPFGFVLGTGDYLAFDTDQINKNGLLILDGFHEVSPLQWKRICFGLHNWLKLMTKNRFNPFWLKCT